MIVKYIVWISYFTVWAYVSPKLNFSYFQCKAYLNKYKIVKL